jgi:hypothetical protein
VQETEYPWSGRVRIKILSAPEKEFALKLRIPGWAKEAMVRVNRRPGSSGRESIQTSAQNGQSLRTAAATYHGIRRVWKSGDSVELDLRMDAELIEANPLVEETLGQVAVKRGPVVYCVESVDLPKEVKPLNLLLSSDMKLHSRYDERLLGGVVVLEGTASARSNSSWAGQLYRELPPVKVTPVKLRLIPYCVWANRGRSEMSVWLPLANQ